MRKDTLGTARAPRLHAERTGHTRAFNEIRLATDHTSNNDTKVIRTIVTFKQAGILVDAISPTEITKNNKLIVDISKISPWSYSRQCYLMLDAVFGVARCR